MTAGLKGNPASLSALAARLKKLPVRVAQVTAARVAPQLTDHARASFAAGRTPYGAAWLPGVDGKPVTLRKSGRLFSTLTFAAVGTRVRAVLGVPYARYHIGKRRILPAPGAALPAPWAGSISTIANAEIRKGLAG